MSVEHDLQGYFIINYHVNITEAETLYLSEMHAIAIYAPYFWNTTILFPHFEVLAYFLECTNQSRSRKNKIQAVFGGTR